MYKYALNESKNPQNGIAKFRRHRHHWKDLVWYI